jgi:hypothetical protein
MNNEKAQAHFDATMEDILGNSAQRTAALKIKHAFPCLTDAAVLMMWHGLRAQQIEDIDAWLNQQPLPRKGSKEAIIDRLIAEGLRPPTNIRWTPFCNLVRNAGNGWMGKGANRKPAWGFDTRTIQNYVRGVKR